MPNANLHGSDLPGEGRGDFRLLKATGSGEENEDVRGEIALEAGYKETRNEENGLKQ